MWVTAESPQRQQHISHLTDTDTEAQRVSELANWPRQDTNSVCLAQQVLLKEGRSRRWIVPHHQVARKTLREISVRVHVPGVVCQKHRVGTSECTALGWVRHLLAPSLFPHLYPRNEGIHRQSRQGQ